MKQHYLLSLSLLALLMGASAASAQPRLEARERHVELDTIVASAGARSFEYTVINQGDAPAVILQARVACSCTKVAYPRAPIAAGDSARIEVTYNPTYQPLGNVRRTVTLHTNASPAKTQLVFKGVNVP